MNNEKKFVMTSDEITRDLLERSGLKLINSEDGRYIFLNESNKIVFTSDNIVFTNKLFI